MTAAAAARGAAKRKTGKQRERRARTMKKEKAMKRIIAAVGLVLL